MKKIQIFILGALLTSPMVANGATPTFGSFYTNDFTVVTNLIAPWIIHANRTGNTNVFSGFTVIYTNSTIGEFFSTNITDGGVVIFTNSIVEFTNTTVTINGTNAATINPTDGRIPYRSGTNSFDDSALYFVDTNTVAAFELDTQNVGVTNLVTGGVVVSFDSGLGFGYLTNLPAGTGVLINDGANHLMWNSISNYWTNILDVLHPASASVTGLEVDQGDGTGTNIFSISNSPGYGQYGFAWTGAGGDVVTTVFQQQTDGGGNSTSFEVGTNGVPLAWFFPFAPNGTSLLMADSYITHTSNYLAEIRNNRTNQFTIAAVTDIGAGDGSKLFGSDGKFHDSSGAGTIINATDTYLPARQSATSFTNSPLYTIQGTNIALDGQVIFGPGTTNVLQRNVNNLEWTNSATTGNGVLFDVINGNGVRARFGVDQDEQVAVVAPSGKFIKLEANNGNQVYGASSTGFYPVGTNQALGLGTTTNNFWSYSAIGSSNQWKFLSVTEGVTTNITVNINGKTYTFQAW